ncbi:isocitrate lyase/phosphoenolpyruvate mutase family protein [Kribbella sp. NPDC049227]|uniref:isocitrate lyase/PEP mutase family protein n=1 Tax=Kribbella sp. NPDC049227 TaxID=3364113 RepID=UPI00371C49D9
MSDLPRKSSNLASALRALHVPGDPLVLPNAWDAASAKAVVAAGFPVVATSSLAVSTVLGYDDGESMPVEEMLAAAARITRVVDHPVTVDFERGYGLEPTELVERFVATGAAGLNLEDSDPPTGDMVHARKQAEFLAAVREAAVSAGVDLVINARIDVFLRGAGSHRELLDAGIDRGVRYLAAGVDCVYPIAVANPTVIRTLVEAMDGRPVNVGYSRQGRQTVADLAALGVARVSFGPNLQGETYRRAAAVIAAIKADRKHSGLVFSPVRDDVWQTDR